jgi:hypothetical protein
MAGFRWDKIQEGKESLQKFLDNPETASPDEIDNLRKERGKSEIIPQEGFFVSQSVHSFRLFIAIVHFRPFL